MYLRESRQKRADGTLITHLQLVESVWNSAKRRSEIRIVFNCGRAEEREVSERLKRLAKSILKRVAPEEIVAQDASWKLLDAWPYGDIYVLEALWNRLGIGEIIAEQAKARHLGFAVERALFAMVANRACAASSKLYCYEQWLREDVRMHGSEALKLQHLYRAMDFLEANKDAIERAIYFRVADLLNLDVEVINSTTPRRCTSRSTQRITALAPTMRSRAAKPPGRNAIRRRGKRWPRRRTGATMCRKSSSVSRSPAMASRCAIGCFPAIRWMSPRSPRSRPISRTGD
jgi:hypothetical protein